MDKNMDSQEKLEALKERISALIATEDPANRCYYQAQMAELSREETRSDRFFSSLLEIFVHLEFEEKEAVGHWERIVDHATALSQRLERKVGIHLTIVDYFTNINRILKTPLLIEIHVFKQTERMAMVDSLTGVFNRRYMEMSLKKEFNRCARYRKCLSVFILDIDDFKRLNDSRGHVFGDQVLKELARFLREVVREEDVVCRYGGEEFLIVLPETCGAGAIKFAERARLNLKENEFFKEHRISFSGGTATFPETGASVLEIVSAADKALYRAKFAGKDRVLQAVSERRLHDRYPRSWSLSFSILADSEGKASQTTLELARDIITQNVSKGGVKFECKAKLELDQLLALEFKALDASEENLSARGRVTWMRKLEQGHYGYGVQFAELSAEAEELLSGCLPVIDDEQEDL